MRRRTWAHPFLAACLVLPACLADPADPGPPPAPQQRMILGFEHPLFQTPQAREFDMVVDADRPNAVTLAFIVPRSDANFPSWLAIAKTDDAGVTWRVREFCGDPLQVGPAHVGCPFAGARLTSDPVLLRLSDGTILYVGVMMTADSVVQFAARFGKDAMTPSSVHVVSRSAFNLANGTQLLPAPYRVYYNGKANVMQDQAGTVHLVWAANLVPHESRPAVGLPFWTSSRDGGRTWTKPIALTDAQIGDPDALYAVGVQAFQTLDRRHHAIWWESRTNALYQVTSTDGGATFSKPSKIQDAVARPTAAPVNSDNLTRPWVGVDTSEGPHRGTVYVLYDELSTGDRDLYLLVSTDHARTWTSQRVDTIPLRNGRDETMARLLVEPDGAVSILYPSWQKLERWSPYEMRFARSIDGGGSFLDVLLSSDASPLHNPGDYNALVKTWDGILNVWEDGRGGTDGQKFAWQRIVRVEVEGGPSNPPAASQRE